MEEVDNIILQTLHQIGMTFPDNVTTLKELPEKYVLLSTKKCLDIINGNKEDLEMPQETAQKIVIANEIISYCKKLGYKEKLGYELLLYPNETDTRKILTFLINKLPKEADKTYMYVMRDEYSILMQSICQKISEDLDQPWAPAFCNIKNFRVESNGKWSRIGCSFIHPFDKIPFRVSDGEDFTKAFQNYWEKNVPNSNTYEINKLDSSDSEREANAIIEKLKLSKSNHLTKRNQISKENLFKGGSHSFHSYLDLVEDSSLNQENSELSVKDVATVLNKIEEESKILVQKIDESKIKQEQIEIELATEKSKESAMKNNIETLSLVTSLLPDIENNMEKLQKIHEKETNKLLSLKNEMAALEITSQKEKEIIEKKKLKHSKHFKTIKTLEDKVKRLSDEHHKQKIYKKQLYKDIEKKNLKKKYIKKRSAYTKRIMEIIGNISKQKVEINKILSDTRILQKEMNNMNGRLDRSFTVVDELVFKDAKRDEHARKTYKLVAYIHTGCSDIVTKVNEIGSYLREIRDLEKHVETEKKKNITENLQRVYLDLKYVQSKNIKPQEN